MTQDQFPPLRRSDMSDSPFEQFERWYSDAQATNLIYPEAMAVATASANGRPSVRYVLLRGRGKDGFVFNTNYDSQKGREITAKPQASLLFYWDVLGRQVRISGRVERVEEAASDEYFMKRPRQSRLSARASEQSSVIPNRKILEDRYAKLEREFESQEVTRPSNWGGFRVIPDEIEFWQHQNHRLHDRFRYRLDEGSWILERLSP